MNEEDRRLLAAKVHVQQLVLVELCRRTFTLREVETFFAPVSVRGHASDRDQEFAEALNEALAAFRLGIIKPKMGAD